MYKVRMSFAKLGTARYISHLDLMQVFRRAFSRAGLRLCYSGGYHPHMQMNILLPLSTGFSSECELLDFELDGDHAPSSLIERLNAVLPEGVRVLRLVDSVRRAGEIASAEYDIRIEGDISAAQVEELFSRSPLLLVKRTKRGESEVDIQPMIRWLHVQPQPEGVTVNTALAAGQESLNPEYIVQAIERYLGAQDLYTAYHRRAIYGADGEIFQ